MPDVQADYEKRLKRYARLIHAVDRHGLIGKLQMFRSLKDQAEEKGERLWKIEPLLMFLIPSLEMDLHITMAKFFEDSGYGIENFLRFCQSNQRNIRWVDGGVPANLLTAQLGRLEEHSETIRSIRERRNKIYAHTDRQYQDAPEQALEDFPLSEESVIELAQCLIEIVRAHQIGLGGSIAFDLAEFFDISVDNMVRNLETGRRHNFPDQDLS